MDRPAGAGLGDDVAARRVDHHQFVPRRLAIGPAQRQTPSAERRCRSGRLARHQAVVAAHDTTVVGDDRRAVGSHHDQPIAGGADVALGDGTDLELLAVAGVARLDVELHDAAVDRHQAHGVAGQDGRSHRRCPSRAEQLAGMVEHADGGLVADVLGGHDRVAVDRQREAGEERGLVPVEGEQHALEVARIGDQYVPSRRVAACCTELVAGTGDGSECIGVELVARRAVHDQSTARRCGGDEHRQRTSRRSGDAVCSHRHRLGVGGVVGSGQVDHRRHPVGTDRRCVVDDGDVGDVPQPGSTTCGLPAVALGHHQHAGALVYGHHPVPLDTGRPVGRGVGPRPDQVGHDQAGGGEHGHHAADGDGAPEQVVRMPDRRRSPASPRGAAGPAARLCVVTARLRFRGCASAGTSACVASAVVTVRPAGGFAAVATVAFVVVALVVEQRGW